MTTHPPFRGFTFDGIHSSRFGVYYISKSNNYDTTFSGKLKNNSLSVQGYDGEYFFGTNLGKKSFTLECAVYEATEQQLRGLQHWLRPGKTAQLVLDGLEYKYITVVIAKAIKFKFMPREGTHETMLYNGFFSLAVEAHDPYSYSTFYAVNNFQFTGEWDSTTTYVAGDLVFYQDMEYECNTGHTNQIPTNESYWDEIGDAQVWYWESGLLFEDWSPDVSFTYGTPLEAARDYILYNGGNAPTAPIITIDGSWDSLTLTNEQTEQAFTLTADGDTYPVVIDCNLGQVTINDVLKNNIHIGDFIHLLGTGLSTQIEVSATNGSANVALDSGYELQDDMEGRFMCFDGYAYEITDVDEADATEFTISDNFGGTTGTHTVEIVDANVIALTGTNLSIDSIDFQYKYVYY